MSLKAKDLFNIEGRVALVTGGASGVGKMIASVFAANGARTYITGRNPERLAAAAAELGALGDCRPLEANISTLEGVEKLAAAITAREAGLNILVNNAGATWASPIETFPESGWDRVFDLNVKAPFFLTQKLLPLLAAAADDENWSRVINISSVGARAAGASSASYNASKAAIEQLTRVMAKGYGPHRVTANAIAPGWFPSRMNAPILESAGEDWLNETPLHRFGTAEDMGGLAMFLCSRAGVYVNGQVIDSDGGRLI
jgi:NAD(P)-dependent dehydrogenase (short-subunit alcohol dehydrogenase family)